MLDDLNEPLVVHDHHYVSWFELLVVWVQAYFVALGVACFMALLLLAPMSNLKSYVQREAIKKNKLKLKAA